MTEPTQPDLPLNDPAASAAAKAAVDASQSSQSADTGKAQDPSKTQAQTRPDWLPEQFWDKDKSEVKGNEFKADLESLTKLKAETDARAALVPAKAEDYKAELPKDFKAPEGVTIDANDPRLAELRTFAHKNGWSQDQFANVLALDAQRVIAHNEQIKTAIVARDKALGDNGVARVEAVTKWIDSICDGKPDVAKQLKATLWTPAIVEFMEGVQRMATSQGVQAFSGFGRETDRQRNDGKPANWDSMSAVDRRAWNLAQQRAA